MKNVKLGSCSRENTVWPWKRPMYTFFFKKHTKAICTKKRQKNGPILSHKRNPSPNAVPLVWVPSEGRCICAPLLLRRASISWPRICPERGPSPFLAMCESDFVGTVAFGECLLGMSIHQLVTPLSSLSGAQCRCWQCAKATSWAH